MEKLHYYAFSFSTPNAMGSVYIGFKEPMVSVPRIENAKLQAGMPKNAVLIGLAYMGYMTPAEVNELRE